jgi:gluconolactonase
MLRPHRVTSALKAIFVLSFFVMTAGAFAAEAVVSEPADLAATIFAKGAEWRLLGGGYKGCEGPQWIVENGVLTLHYAAQHDFLAFKWTEQSGLQTWRNDSPEATSFRPDGQGGYYVVEQTNRRLVRWDANGKLSEVLADKFEGKRLNRPNDVIVKRDGTLWFTDPDFLFKQRPEDVKELHGQFVYRFDPKAKQLTAPIRDLTLPNGIVFSPDERWLYVTDSATPNLYRWPMNDDGSLGERTTFATLPEKGLDGLAFDPAGHLWCAAKMGIHVFTAEGRELGVIKTPAKPTAFAFAPAPSRLVCVTVRDAAYITELNSTFVHP